VRAGSERDVTAIEFDEFGHPQAGLDRDEHEGVVTSTFPPGAVRSG
jgi:hypothetical protein